ncbi:hypothetical protein ASC70_12465 [Caulobacter sp. Root343]|nr:hypothetical protein ASC70_12465 [Caulobacter sp. Root343]
MWIRAGQIALITGLDWAAIMAVIPDTADREKVEHLVKAYERGLVSGSSKLAAKAASKAPKE